MIIKLENLNKTYNNGSPLHVLKGINLEVEQGELAAVRVGEEATLKHFHRQGDAVMLLADNAAVCPPMFYAGEQLSELHIEGKAVGLCRGL